MVSWAGRRYLARAQRKGLDLSRLRLFPASALMPLRRTGLDPVAELGRLRRVEPVSRLRMPVGVTVWLVTGYEQVRAVLGHADGYSTDFLNLLARAGLPSNASPGGLGFTDPPAHTRLRRLLTPEFTMRRLARLAPSIHTIVGRRLDAMAAMDGPVDLVEQFAFPIPSQVICELLGVPYEDRDRFQEMSTARFELFAGAGYSLDAMSEAQSYLLEIIAAQRQRPGDGLLGQIIAEHGTEIDDLELAGLADGILTGGFETTASMLALGSLVLLRDPAIFAAVRDDDDAVNPLVEELLRYLTVVQVAFPRVARQDTEIAGIPIAAGDVVLCSLSGANRDQRLGPDPERFRPDRAAPAHLAFGHGIHRCVGAELARMELRTAYPALVRRFPRMRLNVPPEALDFRETSIVYGVESLPVLLS